MVFNIQTTYHIAQKATVFLVWLIAITVKNQPCINLVFPISLFSPPLKCDFTSSREIDLPGWELLLQIFTFEFQRSFLHSSSCSDAVLWRYIKLLHYLIFLVKIRLFGAADRRLLSRDVEAVIFQTLPLPHLSLPLPPTKNEKTTVDNFFKLL